MVGVFYVVSTAVQMSLKMDVGLGESPLHFLDFTRAPLSSIREASDRRMTFSDAILGDGSCQLFFHFSVVTRIAY